MSALPKQSGAVLWLHDLGESNPNEFAGVAQQHIPWLNINCPAAPLQKFSGSEKPTRAWFAGQTTEGLHESVKYVHERLDYLQTMLSIDSSRILIGGFGQGGALAISAGLSYPKQLAGIASHSGFVCDGLGELEHLRSAQSQNRRTPIMIIHGDDDETVDPAAASAGASVLRTAGAEQVVVRTFEDVAHKMAPSTLSLLVDFIRARLSVNPPTPTSTAQTDGPAPAAKSRTVIKMNGRQQLAESATSEQTTPAYAAGRPTAATDAFAVFNGTKGSARSSAPQPQVSQLGGGVPATAPTAQAGAGDAPKVDGTKSAPRATAPTVPSTTTMKPTTAATGQAGGGASAPKQQPAAVSSDAATAKALASGDAEALKVALATRGDEAPLGEAEMMAIAQLMLGEQLQQTQGSGADAMKALQSLAAEVGNKASPLSAMPRGSVPAAVDEPAVVDSDDDEPADGVGRVDVTDAMDSLPPSRPAAPQAANAPMNYELSEQDGDLRMVVRLPERVTSMAQLEVDISADEIEVNVEGHVYARLPLTPRKINDAEAKASFAKKANELRIRAPLIT